MHLAQVTNYLAFSWMRRSNLHDGGTIVGDGLLAILIHHQQVSAIGAKGRLDGRLDSQTGIDVGHDLALALGGVGACTGILSALEFVRDSECRSRAVCVPLKAIHVMPVLASHGGLVGWRWAAVG